MDLSAFYLHIASELGCSVCLYTRDNVFRKQYSKRIDLSDPLRVRTGVSDFLFEENAQSAPVLSVINHSVTYALCEDDEQKYLIGPVLTDPSVGIRRNLDIQGFPEDFKSILNTPPIHTLVSHILLLHNCINPPGLSSLEFFNLRFSSRVLEESARKNTVKDLFGRREYGELHNPYDNEMRLLSSIENGNTDTLKAAWEEEYSGKFGVTAKDPVRNGKNLAIGTIVLASRAAIRGGLHYETAFSMCDSYEIQVEDLKDMTALQSLVQNAEYTFTEMVRDIQKSKIAGRSDESLPILERCRNYIHAHLHGKLTVQDVAAALHVHPNYLSTLFHKSEGIPLYEYILKEKIKLAENLLIYSSFTTAEIAEYLGFSSQSHLGTHFKKQTGYTLRQYRETFRH